MGDRADGSRFDPRSPAGRRYDLCGGFTGPRWRITAQFASHAYTARESVLAGEKRYSLRLLLHGCSGVRATQRRQSELVAAATNNASGKSTHTHAQACKCRMRISVEGFRRVGTVVETCKV